MKTLKRLIHILILLMAWSGLAIAKTKKGTESGGGGGVVFINQNHPVLLDYFTILNTIDEIPKSSIIPSKVDAEGSLSDSDNAFIEAKKMITRWSHMPYDVMSYLVLSVFHSSITWNFTDSVLNAPAFYLAPALPKDTRIEVAAYYKEESDFYGSILISKPIWNQLQLNDQIGLLIHEALRHVQIGFRQFYNDETLQRVTAIYLLCQPNARLNYYMFYLLNNSPTEADRIYGQFEKLVAKECKRTKGIDR